MTNHWTTVRDAPEVLDVAPWAKDDESSDENLCEFFYDESVFAYCFLACFLDLVCVGVFVFCCFFLVVWLLLCMIQATSPKPRTFQKLCFFGKESLATVAWKGRWLLFHLKTFERIVILFR